MNTLGTPKIFNNYWIELKDGYLWDNKCLQTLKIVFNIFCAIKLNKLIIIGKKDFFELWRI